MLVFWGDQAKREQLVPIQPNIKIKATCFIYNLNESFPWLQWLPSGATARNPEVVTSDVTTNDDLFLTQSRRSLLNNMFLPVYVCIYGLT